MKKNLLLIIMCLVWFSGNAQNDIEDPKPVYIGLDVVKSLPSYVFPNKYLITRTVILEPYIIFSGIEPNKHWMLSGGFAHGTSNIDPDLISKAQRFQGVYFKMAFENQYKRIPLRFGYGPLISIAGFRGQYTFKGPTFGDYTGNFTDDQNFAFGAETYLAYDLKLSKKLMLRFQLRTAIAVRMSGNISPDYFPGIGITKGLNSFLISPGFSTQLFYKVH